MFKKFNKVSGGIVLMIGICAIGFARIKDSFFHNASQINIAEIQTGKLAERKGNSEVSKIGKQMVIDHTVAENELIGLAKKLDIRLDTALDPEYVRLLSGLNQLSGKPFDSTYMASQFLDHQKAISLFSEESKTGTDPSAKAYAGKYLPKLQMHLQMFLSNERAIKITMDSSNKK